MKRSIPILFILVVTTGCRLLDPAPAGAQKEDSAVTVESDGENLVLISNDAKNLFLVFGFLRGEKGEDPETRSAVQLGYLEGKQTIPAEKFAKLLVLEVTPAMEVHVRRKSEEIKEYELEKEPQIHPFGQEWLWYQQDCHTQICIVPVPPPPPYQEYRGLYEPAPALQGKP